ncbi:amidohydrolase family protein [Verrucomicrobia bacterium]|nr:amidohydrolase family protein [Verrucomicrobiota bacterium]
MKFVIKFSCVWVVSNLVFCPSLLGNSSIPGEAASGPIAIVGGTLYPVTSPPIEHGTLLIRDGKIAAIGKDVEIPIEASRVDVSGMSVYPGLFNSDGRLGLVASRDFSEVGRINPNVRVEVAVNPDSELLPVTRSGGVLLSLTVPEGGLVSGTSAILQMDGWTWEDLTLKAPVGLHINWPRMRGVTKENSGKSEESPDEKSIRELRSFFENARAYHANRSGKLSIGLNLDLRFEALKPILKREIPIIVAAESAAQIQSAISFAVEQSVRIIIYGGYDAEACASLLKRHDIPVIIGGTHRLPRRRSEPYDAPFTLPNRLRLAGVSYCITANDSFGAPNTRNLPYQAGHAVAFGLPHNEGLKAITIYPARILGVSDRVGSLEIGKDATVIVTTGDPLETTTQVTRAFIQGKSIDLSDRHKSLWKKYRERLRRLGLLDGE